MNEIQIELLHHLKALVEKHIDDPVVRRETLMHRTLKSKIRFESNRSWEIQSFTDAEKGIIKDIFFNFC